MENEKIYHEQVDIKNIMKLREIIATLPRFLSTFFLGISETTSTRTRINYAYDIRVFFEYMHNNNPVLKKTDITDYTIDILDQITKQDIEEYLSYCSLYYKNDKEYINHDKGKKRKLSSLKSMYNYFYKAEMIKTNPASIVDMPKIHEKEIVRMDSEEVSSLLDSVENGYGVTKGESRYYEKTRLRDLALLTLMLGTGIRVSECVGLDIKDVDFKNMRIKVYRKGGYESMVYFGDEVKEALMNYLEERNANIETSEQSGPLFLSLQNKRIGVRTVEKLVKKYTSRITTMKKITPHKLRSTYGTNLYRESGDIYLVAEVLGHKDVNTTRKHYAAIDEDLKQRASQMVQLRDKSNSP